MSKKWTEEEIEFLIENYKKEGAKYCSDVLNRKIYAIRKKANMLNISYAKNKGIYEKEFIQKVVNDSVSYKEALIKMGLRAAGGNYKILKKYINLYGLSISHFESPEELSKRNLFKDKTPLDEVLVENSTYSRTSLKIRLYDVKILERECSLCGQGEDWNGMKISLILDHINGIYNDNRLEIICMFMDETIALVNEYHHHRHHKLPIYISYLKSLCNYIQSIRCHHHHHYNYRYYCYYHHYYYHYYH